MKGRVLLSLLFLGFLCTDLFAQRKSDRRTMEPNPEYLRWLEMYGDSLERRDPRLPRMQPNPEYIRWLAEQEQGKLREDIASRQDQILIEEPDLMEEEDIDSAPPLPVAVKRPEKDLIMGLAFSGTAYYGDLNYSGQGLFGSQFVNFQPGATLSLKRDAPRILLPSFHIGYGRFVVQNPDIQAVTIPLDPLLGLPDKDTTITPNSYAETDLVQGDFILLINPIRRDAVVKPWFGFGVGAMAFYPKAQDGILLFRKRSTRAPQEASYGTLAVNFPLVVGVDYHLSRKLSLSVSYLYRHNTTDYLDNIGILGQHQGNDQLHSLRLGMNFRIFDARTY